MQLQKERGLLLTLQIAMSDYLKKYLRFIREGDTVKNYTT
jgi:hypothetical protein